MAAVANVAEKQPDRDAAVHDDRMRPTDLIYPVAPGSEVLREQFRNYRPQSGAADLQRSETMVQWIDRQRLASQVLAGTFLNLGSSAAVEIAAGMGFDWLLLDLEHGSGSWADLRPLLLAAAGSSAVPIVRVRSADADDVKFVMDSGAAGIMFPYIGTPAEAARAVSLVKYPPLGVRGVAQVIRATSYGRAWQSYLAEANARSLVIVQIETPEAVEQAEAIAAVPGVDVLFVGPMDLSVNMGHPGDFTQPLFLQHLQTVVRACERHGRTAGILSRPELVEQHKAFGFRFVALGSDASAIATGMTQNLAAIRRQGLVGHDRG